MDKKTKNVESPELKFETKSLEDVLNFENEDIKKRYPIDQKEFKKRFRGLEYKDPNNPHKRFYREYARFLDAISENESEQHMKTLARSLKLDNMKQLPEKSAKCDIVFDYQDGDYAEPSDPMQNIKSIFRKQDLVIKIEGNIYKKKDLTDWQKVLLAREYELRKRKYIDLCIKKNYAHYFQGLSKKIFKKIDFLVQKEFNILYDLSSIVGQKAVGIINEARFMSSFVNRLFYMHTKGKFNRQQFLSICDLSDQFDHNKIDFALVAGYPIKGSDLKKIEDTSTMAPFSQISMNSSNETKQKYDFYLRQYLPIQFMTWKDKTRKRRKVDKSTVKNNEEIKNLVAYDENKALEDEQCKDLWKFEATNLNREIREMEKKINIWKKGGALIMMENDTISDFYLTQTIQSNKLYNPDDAINEAMGYIFAQITEIEELLKEATKNDYKLTGRFYKDLQKEDYDKIKLTLRNLKNFKKIYQQEFLDTNLKMEMKKKAKKRSKLDRKI